MQGKNLHVKIMCISQVERSASATALRQLCALRVLGMSEKPLWLDLSERRGPWLWNLRNPEESK